MRNERKGEPKNIYATHTRKMLQINSLCARNNL